MLQIIGGVVLLTSGERDERRVKYKVARGRNSLVRVRVYPSEFRVSPEFLPRSLGTREPAACGHSGLTRDSRRANFTSLTRFRTRLDVYKWVRKKRHIVILSGAPLSLSTYKFNFHQIVLVYCMSI
jgi:hypothetical protein